MIGLHLDITDRKVTQLLLEGQNRVLGLVASGADMQAALTELAREVERVAEGALVTVLLLGEDGVHVRHGAAPSLPEAFVRAIDGQPIGPRAGSCGTAMYRREPVIVEDIATDLLWGAYRDVARAHGLRACWATPIFDEGGQVLGSFAMYYREPSLPRGNHARIIEMATSLAAIAITRSRATAQLRASEAQLRRVIADAPVAIAMFDHDMRYVAHSDRWITDYQLPPGSLAGRRHYEVFPEVPERWKSVHQRALSGELVQSDADPFVRGDGTTQWLSWDVRPWRTPAGAIGGIIIATVDITRRKDAERQLVESRDQLRRLAAGLERAREAERARIARELHDELGQALTGAKMDLAWLQSRLPAGALQARAAAITALLDETVALGRRLATELRPGVLDDLGLAAAIRWQVQDFARRTGIGVALQVPEELPVDDERSTTAFRIVQEALTNVAKHAEATTVEVVAGVHDGALCVTVTDNGVGLARERLPASGSLGILGMQERAATWGGRVEVGADAGGTRVRAWIPLAGRVGTAP